MKGQEGNTDGSHDEVPSRVSHSTRLPNEAVCRRLSRKLSAPTTLTPLVDDKWYNCSPEVLVLTMICRGLSLNMFTC